ncbi:MSP domain protein, partial [Teladorsagia circumcincta]
VTGAEYEALMGLMELMRPPDSTFLVVSGRGSQKNNRFVASMPLKVEPLEAVVAAAGGKSTHQLTNNFDQRVIYKIRSTNNDEYRVRPVFGFVDPAGNASIEVTRLNGPPKDDRIVQFAPALKNASDAKEIFGQTEVTSMFSINLSAT